MSTLFRIARKEFGAFFSSPVAFIFLGTFLATTLFIFFLGGDFFLPQYNRTQGLV
ncbi:ABC-2 type transport system permease protein [Candidatus Electrothrix aarhusensis]|uniref:ABC-2 type transport system permease protein n=1 Tax=Candidatus Electrothrix aarhusensis TaxID=1859131 RepID=A0A3S3QH48_9BACT|nr:ABC-2 type transport system permease protein [Candidatus Electrothrix aarhusensis]